MPEQDPPGRSTLQYHGLNEVAAGDGHSLRSCNARVGRPRRERYGDHCVLDARSERGGESQRQNKARKGEEDVGDPHQHAVDPATQIARHCSNGEADGDHDHRHQQDDGQGDPRAVERSREDVAAEFVASEPVRLRRRCKPAGEVLIQRRFAHGEPGRKDCQQDEHSDDQEPDKGRRITDDRADAAIDIPKYRLAP